MSEKVTPPSAELLGEIRSLTDEQLFDEIRAIVNQSRFTKVYDRTRAVAIGTICRERNFLSPVPLVAERFDMRW